MMKILMHINYSNSRLPHYERKNVSWFIRYETTNPITTWGKVQDPFVSRFNDVCSKKQAIVTFREVKQWKHETIEDYYDIFL
jgi:hypothetical protein